MITRFGGYELDDQRFEIRSVTGTVPVETRVFNLILYLASNAHRVISKAELLEKIWPGRHVTDGSLSVAVAAARRALGDDAVSQRVIKTHHGRGYQLVAPVTSDVQSPTLCHPLAFDPKAQGTDFVGRAHGLHELHQAATRILAGQSALVMISGEPGIGKTRLLDEFYRGLSYTELPAATGRCSESGDAPAMWPWSQVLRTLNRNLQTDWTQSLGEQSKQALSMIAPEMLPDHILKSHAVSRLHLSRFQFFESLAEVLETLLAKTRMLIALDDIHRADSSTLGFFQFAVRELRHLPIGFVAIYRNTELRNTPHHARALADLTRQPHAVTVALQGLNPSETALLFRKVSAQELSSNSAAALHSRTGGNPFFIRQLAALNSAIATEPRERHEDSIPPTLRHAILEQISGLAPDARTLVSVAAVLGRELAIPVLSNIVDLAPERFDIALGELLDAGILRPINDRQINFAGDAQLSFVHILVRDALYENLRPSERRSLHEKAGNVLAAKYQTTSGTHLAEIAYHFFEAQTEQSLARAQLLSEAAAQVAADRSAHDDAARHYTRALDAQRLVDPTNEHERCRLLLALGTEQSRAGQRSGATETFACAATLARSLGAGADLAKAALGVAPGFLAAEVGNCDAFLVNLLTEARATAVSSQPALAARLSARLAMALHWSDAIGRMHESMATARELADELNDLEVRLHINFARWFCEWHHTGQRFRHRLAEEIQSDADRLGDSEMALVATMLRQVGMLERGECTAFDLSLQTFAGMASSLRQPHSLWYGILFRSMRALLEGRFRSCGELQTEFATVAARVQDSNAVNSLIMQRTMLQWETGSVESMIDSLIEGTQLNPNLRGFRAALAWAHCKNGNFTESLKHFTILSSRGFSDVPERFDWSVEITLCSEICSDLRDSYNASLLYELLRPLRESHLILGLGVLSFGSADRLLARLSETMGLGEQAEAHFRVALERNASAGAHAWTAHTKFDFARFLAQSGEVSRRDYWMRLASEAYEAATGLGMTDLRGRSEAFLQGSRDDRKNDSRA